MEELPHHSPPRPTQTHPSEPLPAVPVPAQAKASTGQTVIPALTKVIWFPLQPGKGSLGTKHLVMPNHFIAQLLDKDIHLYDVCFLFFYYPHD